MQQQNFFDVQRRHCQNNMPGHLQKDNEQTIGNQLLTKEEFKKTGCLGGACLPVKIEEDVVALEKVSFSTGQQEIREHRIAEYLRIRDPIQDSRPLCSHTGTRSKR